MRLFTRGGLLVATIGTALLLAACGGDTDGGTSGSTGKSTPATGGGAGTTVNVTMTEWEVKPSPAAVNAGSTKFSAKNSGTQPHELVVIKSDLEPGALPVASGVVDLTKVTVAGRTPTFDAGKSADTTISLTAGKYVLICNVAGHYQLGMHDPFTVN